jgi:hypothetical protein
VDARPQPVGHALQEAHAVQEAGDAVGAPGDEHEDPLGGVERVPELGDQHLLRVCSSSWSSTLPKIPQRETRLPSQPMITVEVRVSATPRAMPLREVVVHARQRDDGDVGPGGVRHGVAEHPLGERDVLLRALLGGGHHGQREDRLLRVRLAEHQRQVHQPLGGGGVRHRHQDPLRRLPGS